MQTAASDIEDESKPAPKRDRHLLRFQSVEMFDQIEQARKQAPVKINRNMWLLMAIAEKLARDLPKDQAAGRSVD